MEHARYPQSAYGPGHGMQHSYPQQGPPGGPDMTSPHRQNQPNQSPVLASQHQPYGAPNAAPGSYQMYQQMPYPQQGYMPPMGSQQGMSQAAAMATAAAAGAAGQGYYPHMDPQAMAGSDRRPNSSQMHQPMAPQHMPQQNMQHQRQMSSMRSPPPMQAQYPGPPQPVSRAAQPQTAMPPPSHPPPPGAQQSPEAGVAAPTSAQAEESPLYVNAKQFHRILKRRVARQKLEDQLRISSKSRKPYLHESRHNHAMRRPRGPGGRFLTAQEVEAQDAAGEGGLESGSPQSGDARSSATPTEHAVGKKRKAEDAGGAKKKNKSADIGTQSPSDEADVDGDDSR